MYIPIYLYTYKTNIKLKTTCDGGHMTSSKTCEVKKMTDKQDVKSVKDLILKNEELQAQVNFLQTKYDKLLHSHRDYRDENSFLKRQNQALKFRCSDYSRTITALESEIADMRFTRKYLTSEEAGRKFAQELLGGA